MYLFFPILKICALRWIYCFNNYKYAVKNVDNHCEACGFWWFKFRILDHPLFLVWNGPPCDMVLFCNWMLLVMQNIVKAQTNKLQLVMNIQWIIWFAHKCRGSKDLYMQPKPVCLSGGLNKHALGCHSVHGLLQRNCIGSK